MARTPALVTIGDGEPLRCLVCEGELFFDRPVKLNTGGLEFLGLEWANRSATGLICADCGYVHMFVSDSVSMWDPDGGYPDGDTGE